MLLLGPKLPVYRSLNLGGKLRALIFVGIFAGVAFIYRFAYLFDNTISVYTHTPPEPVTITATMTVTKTTASVSTITQTASLTSTLDPKKLAFMVETRSLPHLPLQLSHMASIIPPEWTFKFMGSNASIDYLLSFPHLRDLAASKKLTLLGLPPRWSVSSRESISQMFTDPALYELLAPAEHLLVFQPDSIFCTKSRKTLNDFLKYDWVGAPWSATSKYGGNGGLSLRRVSSILQVLKKEARTAHHGELEDLWLSNRLAKLQGATMANATVSKSFSVESQWDEAPLGFHIGWLGVHHEQVSPRYFKSLIQPPLRRLRRL
ncbi:hypothetical protein CJF31_00011068 [Rutstroemia sp. NJR-2017a BVV2]|nr:hypothetical protein CJF31_00011068 [Rutstroemia sp. NJR-2017a BVV2]